MSTILDRIVETKWREIEAAKARVPEGVLERDLVAVVERVDELLEEGEVVVEGVDLRAQRGCDRVGGIAVVVVGIGVPTDREAVDSRHRPVAWPKARRSVEEDVRKWVCDDPLDAGSQNHVVHPAGVRVAASDLVIELLPGVLGDPVVIQLVEVRQR